VRRDERDCRHCEAKSVQRNPIESESTNEMKVCQVEMKRLILSLQVHETALQNNSD